jgi:tRNA(Ile)-lysidine synthase
MSPLARQFRLQWAPYDGHWRTLIACSGGPDSVALLRLLRQIHSTPSQLAVAHFHHGLRGEASDEDARFVAQLCERLAVACHIGHADPESLRQQARGEGLESAARGQRYRFLTQTAEQLGARYLVTGHTADDQAETVLHHVLRGTGLAGLAGMPATRMLSAAVTLVRPLLSFTRAEILAYLQTERQSYREDEHNVQEQFLRSRLRHQLLPLLEGSYYPDVRRSLRRLAQVAHDAHAVIQPLAESLLDRCLTRQSAKSVELDCRPLRDAPEHLCREAFVCLWRRQAWPQQSMTFEHWQRLARTARSSGESQAIDLPGAIHVCRRGWTLELREADSSRLTP